MTDEFERVEVRLPRHLVQWLRIYCKQVAMTPDQFLAYVLEWYREVWKLGFELALNVADEYKKKRKKSEKIKGLEEVLEEVMS